MLCVSGLDHCARARKAGEGGIKALVIYPMNALATDQARRFAELVASIPAFAGLRVGQHKESALSYTVWMTSCQRRVAQHQHQQARFGP